MLNKLKTFFSKLTTGWNNLKTLAKKDLASLWNEYRTVLILLGALILTLKFREWFIDFLVNSSKKLFTTAQKQSESDQVKEDQKNKAADALVNQAQQLQNQKKPEVTVDWNKTQK